MQLSYYALVRIEKLLDFAIEQAEEKEFYQQVKSDMQPYIKMIPLAKFAGPDHGLVDVPLFRAMDVNSIVIEFEEAFIRKEIDERIVIAKEIMRGSP